MRTESIDIIDGTVYFATTILGGEKDDGKCGIYRFDSKGNPKEICSVNAEHISILNNYIYFIDKDNQYRLCSVNKDGSNMNVLIDDFIYSYDIMENWIYFSTREAIFKVKDDGSSKILLSDSGVTSMIIVQDSIYYNYCNFMDEQIESSSTFMSMRTDDNNMKKLLNTGFIAINNFDENTLLCVPYTNTPMLIKYDLATGQVQQLEVSIE